MTATIQQTYDRWLQKADPSLREELRAMDGRQREDAFYRELAFGTGGLRGLIGAGTNRMNVHTVARASQGLADYVKKRAGEMRRVAVSCDSRILSDVFARTAAGVFAANGIEALIYPQLMPTPCLSYAVRALGCAAGVMVTASHNPAGYNGYKVYDPDGCQITTEAAAEILGEIEKLDVFDGVAQMDFHAGIASGLIRYIPDSVYTDYVEAVKKESLLGEEAVDRRAAIVYTPLNGAGLRPVLRVLAESGYSHVTVVPEQEKPDGHFPTCPSPNPELPEAMALGLQYAEKRRADLLIATDPDCDRCGIAVRDDRGAFRLLTGNETGVLLLDYVCRRRAALGRMPENPVVVKTIVTTDLAEAVAAHYGAEVVNVLTGFKFIGETIGRLEDRGERERYIFGFEESCGYLSGTYVRDKDAVNAALLIAEMFCWYRQQGISLLSRLDSLYRAYGYSLSTLHSYVFEGSAGFGRMQSIMAAFRSGVGTLAGRAVEACRDYAPGIDGLPAADVLKFRLSGGASVVVRPSGTEPKLKAYITVTAPREEEARRQEKALADALAAFMG